jgi:DNA-binding beta-propeller fold protein YncE
MRRCSGLLALVLCAFAASAPAWAAAPPGTLAQLAGAGGCASLQRALACTAAHGLDDPRAVALSPDGRTLYVAAYTPAAVTSFSVDSRTGLLQQLNLGAGCVSSSGQSDCASARALGGASAIAVSPDNLHVYVASAAPGAVASFARQPNGSLQQLNGIAGCAATTQIPGCASAPSLAGADAIALSPDGRFAYVGAASVDAITVFTRDAATGRLAPLAGPAGCLRADHAGCTPVTGVDSPSAIAISPDGTSLYATSSTGTLTSFQRDVATGALMQLAPGAGCQSDVALADCGVVDGLARASAVAVSPDGSSVITTAIDDDTVTAFHRDAATGALTRTACVTGLATIAGCTVSPLVDGPRALAIRPDSRVVWVASSRADSILTLQLDPATGGLIPTAGSGGCLRISASLDCRAARSLDDPRGLAVSSDGLRVFAVSALSDGIAVLGPQLAPNCLPIRAATVANRARSVVLACSDPNGDKVVLTILKQPRHGRLGVPAGATGSVLYTPAPGYAGADSFVFQASDGMDVSAPSTATVSVALPAKAPLVRIRTSTCGSSAPPSPSVRVASRRTCSSRVAQRAMASRAWHAARPGASSSARAA